MILTQTFFTIAEARRSEFGVGSGVQTDDRAGGYGRQNYDLAIRNLSDYISKIQNQRTKGNGFQKDSAHFPIDAKYAEDVLCFLQRNRDTRFKGKGIGAGNGKINNPCLVLMADFTGESREGSIPKKERNNCGLIDLCSPGGPKAVEVARCRGGKNDHNYKIKQPNSKAGQNQSSSGFKLAGCKDTTGVGDQIAQIGVEKPRPGSPGNLSDVSRTAWIHGGGGNAEPPKRSHGCLKFEGSRDDKTNPMLDAVRDRLAGKGNRASCNPGGLVYVITEAEKNKLRDRDGKNCPSTSKLATR